MIGLVVVLTVAACLWRWFRLRSVRHEASYRADLGAVQPRTPWDARHDRSDSRWFRQQRGF